jgi:hypothetical protein
VDTVYRNPKAAWDQEIDLYLVVPNVGEKALGTEDSFWLMVSEVLVHGHLDPRFLGCSDTEHGDTGGCGGRDCSPLVRERERERERASGRDSG